MDSDDVLVMVNDGVAILPGKLDSWNEPLAAQENAIEGGAVAVKNKIIIENY